MTFKTLDAKMRVFEQSLDQVIRRRLIFWPASTGAVSPA